LLTQKVVGYVSESTTKLSATGDCYAGLFCSGKQFRGVGICQEGIFVEVGGVRSILRQGQFSEIYLRVLNNSEQNSHQFFYSLDGDHFIPAGDPFLMRGGYWKGIRVGLFCYGNDGMAQFDSFRQNVQK